MKFFREDYSNSGNDKEEIHKLRMRLIRIETVMDFLVEEYHENQRKKRSPIKDKTSVTQIP